VRRLPGLTVSSPTGKASSEALLFGDCTVTSETPVNAVQYGGDHYKKKAIQPWDYIAANEIGYLEGNVIKYVSRWKDKNGLEDLLKAKHYLEKLIELNQ